jgi:para-aminobenzoate synthetase component 2
MTADIEVRRNDRITLSEIEALAPDGICLSPGPKTPKDAGICCEVLRVFGAERRVPMLGVCLGHQCIAAEFGGQVVRAERLMHGKTSEIVHDGRGVLRGIPSPFTAVRYHSLIVDRATLPPELEVSAWTEDQDEIMAIRHRTAPIEGVQFHPESILTEHGKRLLASFLEGGIGCDAK